MIKITEIKKSIVTLLKEVRDIDVSFELAAKTDSNIHDQKMSSWYFVSLIPISNRLFGNMQRDRVLLIDIAYYDRKATYNDYFIWNDEMEKKFLPAIKIGNRNVTIEESSFRIVDEVGHFVFSLKFRDIIDMTSEAQTGSAEESEIDLKII